MASSALQWEILKFSNSFRVKGPIGGGFDLSRDKFNLRSRHSFRTGGLVHRRAVDVREAKDKKGVVLVLRSRHASRFPNKSETKVELKRGSRRALHTIHNVLKYGHYRPELIAAATRRASALLRSQRQVVLKKTAKKTK